MESVTNTSPLGRHTAHTSAPTAWTATTAKKEDDWERQTSTAHQSVSGRCAMG